MNDVLQFVQWIMVFGLIIAAFVIGSIVERKACRAHMIVALSSTTMSPMVVTLKHGIVRAMESTISVDAAPYFVGSVVHQWPFNEGRNKVDLVAVNKIEPGRRPTEVRFAAIDC